MFIRVNRDSYGDRFLGAPPASFKIGGLPVGEDNAHHLLAILAGPSPFQPYLAHAMKQAASTFPKKFFKVATSVSQVPKRLRPLFTSDGGRMTGGTIDRWTRTVYVVPAPGLRQETRLEYALHECVHLFAHPHAPTEQTCPHPCIGTFQGTFGAGFGEGLTQVITEDIMAKQTISLVKGDRPYKNFTMVVREVIKAFGLDAMARAYFFGEVQSLRTSMEARWGPNWRAVADMTSAGHTKWALKRIQELEAAHRKREEDDRKRKEADRKKEEAARKRAEEYRKRIEDLMRTSPRGGFPTPGRERPFA